MKLVPNCTARRRTANASFASRGSPQIPSPVMRIAPKPSRLTCRSPPISSVPAAAAGALGSTTVAAPAALAHGDTAPASTAPVTATLPKNLRREVALDMATTPEAVSGLRVVPLHAGYRPRSYPGASHLGRPCDACVAPWSRNQAGLKYAAS